MSLEWLTNLFSSNQPALLRMRLGPDDSTQNPLMLQFFTWDAKHSQMSWWKHFETEVPHIAELGFSQVWYDGLPCLGVVRLISVGSRPRRKHQPKKDGRGYDAYDLWDLGEFDQKGSVGTRWGTKEELLQACKVAREHGLEIIIDAVLNHKLGADRSEMFDAIPVDPNNRLRAIGKKREIEGWTLFDFPGRRGKYSQLKWTQEHFSGLDWDHKSRSNGVYRLAGAGHKGWSSRVDSELGNYDYLLGVDIDHRHPAVEEDLIRWASWVLNETGGSAFRLDAIKHIDHKFLLKFILLAKKSRQDPRMLAVCEYWSGEVKRIFPYIRLFKGQAAFFDVPLHMNFHEASRKRSNYDLRTLLHNSLLRVRPNDAVTFVDNHDTVVGQTLESWVESHFKIQAYAVTLLLGEGYPCVFYGDIYPNDECYNENTARNVKMLIQARKQYAYGSRKYYPHAFNVVGFIRSGDSFHPGCAVLLSNKESESIHTVRMNVGKEHAGATFRSYMTQHGEVKIDGSGWGDFTCFSNAVQVWVPSRISGLSTVPVA